MADHAIFFSEKYGPLLSVRFVKCFDVTSLTMVARFDFLFGPTTHEARLLCPQAVEISDVLNAPKGEEITQRKMSEFVSKCLEKHVKEDFEFGEMVDFVSAEPPYTHKAWAVNEKWAAKSAGA